MSESENRELDALQAALAAEHAAVYGYGVVGGRIGEERHTAARTAYDAHRARRDALAREVRDLGGKPVAAAAGYALPFAVPDPAAALRLAAELEDRVAGVYSDLVRAAEGDRRATAAGALREAAVRAVRWRGGSVAFPGLAERADSPSTPDAASGSAPGAASDSASDSTSDSASGAASAPAQDTASAQAAPTA
ncbi:ferritin-like domain-containing protein [Streptomyces sp. NPDC000351]|uniref:ferritin-like domain-containing protein n=1 Tax=Streptomyces sp. NPDC000351 TaxID=3154250 RepID=UPI0033291EC1